MADRSIGHHSGHDAQLVNMICAPVFAYRDKKQPFDDSSLYSQKLRAKNQKNSPHTIKNGFMPFWDIFVHWQKECKLKMQFLKWSPFPEVMVI